jgi:hypothetical protein
MEKIQFGDSRFRIVVEEFEIWDPIAHSPLLLTIQGSDWSVGGEYESFGVVVPGLVEFGRNGAARHWGAFVGLHTPDEVIDRVASYAFTGGNHSEPRYWDISSAMLRYALNYIFTANLGVDCAVVVNSSQQETFIVRTNDGVVRAYDVPLKSFKRAIDELAVWKTAIEDGQRL